MTAIRRSAFVSLTASAALAAALALPGLAAASGYYHPANNQAGVTLHPEHYQSSKTREQVRAETSQALRNGDMGHVTESGEPAVKPSTSGLTREQVVGALMSETPQERAARLRSLQN